MVSHASDPIAVVRTQVRDAVTACAGFSCIINLLMLAAPLYMLQIYDRVLPAQGVETLIVLSILLAAAYVLGGFLDFTRSALFARIAMRFERQVAPAAFKVAMGAFRTGNKSSASGAASALQDVGTLRKFLISPAPAVIFDAPWVPIFLITILLIHPLLAGVVVLGGALLFGLALANQRRNATALIDAETAGRQSEKLVALYSRNIEAADAMGMERSLQQHWGRAYSRAMRAACTAADSFGGFAAATRALRMALQSALLGIGAYLAIIQQISPGMIIAASIIGGRALAPIDQAVAQWPSFVSARAALEKLTRILAMGHQEEIGSAPLPEGRGAVSVNGVSVQIGEGSQERKILNDISFELKPGEVLAVIGPSAGGKSTLARLLVGAWQPAEGTVRLDGAEIHHLSTDDRGRQLGYLPQDVELFFGTVAENIARLEPDPDVQAIVNAAVQAGAHDLILRLSNGYETQVGPDGAFLSGGQRQRIGLARALYRDPPLVVLDEPNASLDTAGDLALNDAILARKSRRRTTILMTHRRLALDHADYILVLSAGEQQLFGPKAEVLKALGRMQQNVQQKVTALNAPGGSAE